MNKQEHYPRRGRHDMVFTVVENRAHQKQKKNGNDTLLHNCETKTAVVHNAAVNPSKRQMQYVYVGFRNTVLNSLPPWSVFSSRPLEGVHL